MAGYGPRSVHVVRSVQRAERDRKAYERGEETPGETSHNVTAVMRVTRHDAVVSRRNVLRVTCDECDDTSRLFIAHISESRRSLRIASNPTLNPLSPSLTSAHPRRDEMFNGITRDIAHHRDILDNSVNEGGNCALMTDSVF